MVKQRWKKKGKAAPDVQADADPTTRSIALCDDMVAVAAGRRWRVIDTRSGAVLHDNTSHDAPVRSLAFSPDGQYLVTCGDDKTARVWRTSDWQCLQKLKSGKKSTACTFSADGKHVFFSDRFGDVLCATTLPVSAPPAAAGAEGAPAADKDSTASKDGPSAAAAEASDAVEANLLLGHLQSIVSSLGCCSSSTGEPLIISTDKDGKVRASILPVDPTKGSYEIQSYCLGHTKFVTCSAVVPQQPAAASSSQHLVLSGSGDGTVRLWDVDSGKQLGCYTASEQPPSLAFQQQQQEAGGASAEEEQQQDPQDGQEQGNEGGSGSGSDDERQEQANGAAAAAAAADGDGKQQAAAAAAAADESCKVHHKAAGKYHRLREACCAVLSVAVSPDSGTLAVAVEGQQELQLVSLDTATGQMELLQKLSFADVANPAAAAFDSKGQLWVVGGVLVRDTESAHVGVAARSTDGGQWEPVTAAVLQDDLRAALELRVQDEEEKQQQQQEGYYFEGFKRAVYMVEEGVERPKRPRRDLRDIQRLRALAAAKDQEEEQQKQAAEAAQG